MRASAEVLRSSNFGSSYRAALLTGPALVVKRFREMNGVGREDFHEHMTRLGRLKHPKLLPPRCFLPQERREAPRHRLHRQRKLRNRSAERPTLDWPRRLKIVKRVARGLTFLDKELPTLVVPHGHLKSSNVFLGEDYEPLLTDYGLASVMTKDAKHLLVACQSQEFAPANQVTRKSDVWSFGILILEILTGKYPANFLHQGGSSGGGSDLAEWVNSIAREASTGAVLDKDMQGTANAEGEMSKLLKIGLRCCEPEAEDRWDLATAVQMIEELRETDHDDSGWCASDGDDSSLSRKN
ncbi:hypothetical protein H6P81_009295 [Aristolochia fimbriata]|uniref:Protein kinase domain-containing protein n=1 Tax=Aristolochia fimbriata TaxID=158543 RepID=A0AAV7EKF7_ARIFI|nr:hypothetical protein H6P81_009295 [Aristolochia fimbriata]